MKFRLRIIWGMHVFEILGNFVNRFLLVPYVPVGAF